MIQIEKDTERVNWKKIKAEYLAGDISYRKLADKYGVSEAALTRKAVKDGWAKKRDEVRSKSEAKAKQKIVEKTAETMADNAAIAADIKRSLLLRLHRIEQKYPFDATEVRAKQGTNIVIYRLRDLTAAYKELMDDGFNNDTEETALANADDMIIRIRTAAVGGENWARGDNGGICTDENKTP